MRTRRALLIALLSSLPAAGRAATFYVAPSGSDAGGGASWSDPLQTVGEALRRAAALPGADQIEVAAGRYTESITLAADVVLRGSVDPASGTSDPDRTSSVLDGQGLAAVVVCDRAAGSTPRLEGFVITGGNNPMSGGGIDCPCASPTIRNNRVVGNHADGDGGGMSASGDTMPATGPACNPGESQPVIEDNVFLRNTAGGVGGGLRLSRTGAVTRRNGFFANTAGKDGGGMRLRDAPFSAGQANPRVEDNWFAGNSSGAACAPACDGGGLAVVNSSLTVTRNTYEANTTAGDGGGLSLRDCPSADVLQELTQRNRAAGSGGGIAIKNSAGSVRGTLGIDNVAGADGGGMRVREGGPVAIADSVFSGNTATGNGGGVAWAGVVSTVQNLLATRNQAVAGGGLFVDTVPGTPPAPATVTLVAATLRKNVVTTGSGAAEHTGGLSSFTLTDGIAWGNTGSGDLGGSGTGTVTYSDVESAIGGPTVIHVDPLFAAGGALRGSWRVEDNYLSAVAAGQPMASPCVDAGDQPATALGLDRYTTRTDDAADAGTVDLGFHPPAAIGFAGFDVYRSIVPALPGGVYLPAATPGQTDPEPVLLDVSRPLLAYRVRGVSTLRLVKAAPTLKIEF